MTRRTALAIVAAAAVPSFADPASEVWEIVAGMAAALAEDNAPGFLKPIDPKMPGYGDLAANVLGMIEQADVHSNIAPLDNEGGDASRTLQLDWELRMTRKGEERRTDVREEAVTAQFVRDGKKWRIAKIEPLPFFAPPQFR